IKTPLSMKKICRQGCRQLQASSLCFPECVAREITEHRRDTPVNAKQFALSRLPCSTDEMFGRGSCRILDQSPNDVFPAAFLRSPERRCLYCFSRTSAFSCESLPRRKNRILYGAPNRARAHSCERDEHNAPQGLPGKFHRVWTRAHERVRCLVYSASCTEPARS